MTQEEVENERDDMLIDGSELQNPNPNSTSDGFNVNYLKAYYGMAS